MIYVFFFTLLIPQASDTLSTGRVLKAVVQLCFDAEDWEGLNEHIILLSKRRSQLKTVGGCGTRGIRVSSSQLPPSLQLPHTGREFEKLD